MARDTTQVLVGTGNLYTAPVGTAFPADAETAPAVDWEDVGYSDEGGAFEWDLTFEDIVVAELAEPVDTRWTEVEYRFVIALAQLSLENIQIALNGGTITAIPGPPARNTYTPPTVGGDTALAALFRFENEHGFHTDLQMPRVRNISSVSVPFRKAPDKSIIACSFKLVAPSSGEIFTFDEYVSAA